ncbi:MAG: glycosyl transferase family 28 [Bacteroidetes bacterium]|nr:glycosyl transferase family 28 [Bacteroidota bacterium]MBS1649133.1 glycosyl transferase family 28 [Bacteroidota bacterium]
MKFAFKTILVAPLDWGLGHATRCIPIIRGLQQAKCNVVVAANNKQKSLLQKEFSNIKFIELSGYNIRYTKNKNTLFFLLLWQMFKIFNSINREKKWLDNIIDELKIDVVISDNRFGLSTQKIPCVFITHQLQIDAPYNWLKNIIQKINYQYINKFTTCWVPDFEGENNIAGTLSHPNVMPSIPVQYIGVLSRFDQSKNEDTIIYNCCFLLSGPEPQRTLLEQKILQQLNSIKHLTCCLIRGLPETNTCLSSSNNLIIKNHLPEKELKQIILQSEFVIARSGYTTVMELISLQKKSILIATPGQTEQEYLAKKLMKQNWCYAVNQNSFSVSEAYSKANQFNYRLPKISETNIAIENLLEPLLHEQ